MTTLTIKSGGEPSTQNIKNRYSNVNNNNANNIIRNRNISATTTTKYTGPIPSYRGVDKKINILRNYYWERNFSSNQKNKRHGNSNYQNQSRNDRGQIEPIEIYLIKIIYHLYFIILLISFYKEVLIFLINIKKEIIIII